MLFGLWWERVDSNHRSEAQQIYSQNTIIATTLEIIGIISFFNFINVTQIY